MSKGFSSKLHGLGWGLDSVRVQGTFPGFNIGAGGLGGNGGVQEGGEVGSEDVSDLGDLSMKPACVRVHEDSGTRGLVMVFKDEPVGVLGPGG